MATHIPGGNKVLQSTVFTLSEHVAIILSCGETAADDDLDGGGDYDSAEAEDDSSADEDDIPYR